MSGFGWYDRFDNKKMIASGLVFASFNVGKSVML